eukprot:c9438_g1_i1.p1 GENE.c9438_g1_i1~~c9438_g1_i1.p1  ORF type:complete len:262 (-),score=50.07 c9438_g1_i1:67-852(-)
MGALAFLCSQISNVLLCCLSHYALALHEYLDAELVQAPSSTRDRRPCWIPPGSRNRLILEVATSIVAIALIASLFCFDVVTIRIKGVVSHILEALTQSPQSKTLSIFSFIHELWKSVPSEFYATLATVVFCITTIIAPCVGVVVHLVYIWFGKKDGSSQGGAWVVWITHVWSSIDVAFVAFLTSSLELTLIAKWILSTKLPETCTTLSTFGGEACIEVEPTFHVGIWIALAAGLGLAVLGAFSSGYIRRPHNRIPEPANLE